MWTLHIAENCRLELKEENLAKDNGLKLNKALATNGHDEDLD